MSKLFRFSSILLLGIFIQGCASVGDAKDGGSTIIETPLSITIKSTRNYMSAVPTTSQEIFDKAEKHCQKIGAHSKLESSWVVAFDADYFTFECKKLD